MAFHLLERDRSGARHLAEMLVAAADNIGHCNRCRTLSEHERCHLCANPKRDESQLCVVETPAEVLAIEQAIDYRGLYFVLGGRLSPLDGIGPVSAFSPKGPCPLGMGNFHHKKKDESHGYRKDVSS